MPSKDDDNFGCFIAVYALGMLLGICVWGVIIWAVIEIVTHITGG